MPIPNDLTGENREKKSCNVSDQLKYYKFAPGSISLLIPSVTFIS